MTRKCYNNILQTNREEETQNTYRQMSFKGNHRKATGSLSLSLSLFLSLSLSLSLSLFPSEIITKLETTLSTAQQTKNHTQTPQNNGGNNKQCINNSKTNALERSVEVNGDLNYFSLPNFCLRFCCNMSNQREKKQSSRTGFLTHMYSIYLHWETIRFINII